MKLGHKIVSLIMAFFMVTGCSPDYGIVTNGTSETVYVEVEVPVYVETEVPSDPGEIWIDSFIQPMSVDGVDILWVIDTSGSMNIYDDELLAGIEAMMNALPASGWRLAMTSNDPASATRPWAEVIEKRAWTHHTNILLTIPMHKHGCVPMLLCW